MSANATRQVRIDGTVAPGFESVKRLYEQNMHNLEEKGTQLCVYYRGQRVVDLWASAEGDDSFTADSLINVFSSGKSLESIALATLVGKGLLDYRAKIAAYWPEFANQGKGDLTVADLMRHEAGLAAFNKPLDPADLLTENIKQNKVGRIIEEHAQRYRKGAGRRREYHAVTRGWIANELFRRVDPAGRTMGEFLREEISGPLQVDAIIGVKREELARIKKVSPLGFRFQLIESLKPRFLKRRMEHNIFQILGRIARLLPALRTTTVRKAPPPFKGMERIAYFSEPDIAMGETPSANTNATGRGLAKIAAMMAAGGKWEGREYMTEEAWHALHAEPVGAEMGIGTAVFTQGGVAQFSTVTRQSTVLEKALNTGREGFYGWMGLGGSLFQWHPEYEIGFGYAPTSLNVLDLVNERGKTYQAEVLRCVKQIGVS